MKNLPELKHDELVNLIATQSREPFRDILASFLGVAPDVQAIQYFAKNHPEKWIKAISDLSKISGYTEKHAAGDTNIYVQINNLPDSELHHLLSETLKEIKGVTVEQE